MEIPIKGNIASRTEFPSANEKHSRFNSLKLFLAALSCLYFAKALSGSYMKSTITQIERRFDIPSSLIGVVDGSFEIGNLLVIVFVSYFGAKFHRPRLIAIGSMVMAIGTFLTASPHFFMGRYNYETALTFSSNLTMSTSQCSNTSKDMTTPAPEENSSGCEKAAGSSMWMYIFLGNLLRGIGETPTGPLGISYLDDFATQENTSFYIGILYTVALIGPLFGYLLGSLCAKLFVDIGFVDLERVTITSKDARWVGAWWLGFLIAGAFSLLFSIPFWFFPKSLTKETRKKELGKASEKIGVLKPDQSEPARNNPKPKISEVDQGFLSSLKALFSNSIFVLYLVSMVLHMNALIGMLTFKPKFIEQQYGQSASRSNFLIGLINIPAVCVGFFLGGYVMKRLKLNIVQAAKLTFGCSTLGWLITHSFFAMACENSRVAGLTVSYQGTSQVSFGGSALNHDCNTGCFCSLKQWEPICAGDGVTYVSPCLAGCTTSTGTGKNTVFHNCSCISPLTAGNSSGHLGQCARKDDCEKSFHYFMAVTVLTSLIFCFGAVPGFMILLRCNEPELKSLAIGIHTLLGRTLAGIPAPIYFGALIDKTCLKWGTNRCGGRGACRIYNSDAFRHIFLGLQVSMRGAGLLVFFIIFALLKKRFPAHFANPETNCGTEMMSEQDKDQKSDNGDLTVKTANSDPDKESNV
ncbi:solute carrier organic anion transporter family member 1C1-like [Chiloscyllium plagiosum]|uniref:solute carrier organic anion transporter family member 1C1-like n=1 Tax=Chiloscyllium plagiosum TaxID=36176 RepID=UPI001CB7B0F5|nr:solute carrier organic anion transporter family member 1C1-like [Chiloscyllium plagiosum]XP_043569388.1 solute carrier organic anion transporter family member 1C1-like [Chiloscyllium plagiosum]